MESKQLEKAIRIIKYLVALHGPVTIPAVVVKGDYEPTKRCLARRKDDVLTLWVEK